MAFTVAWLYDTYGNTITQRNWLDELFAGFDSDNREIGFRPGDDAMLFTGDD